MKLVLATSNKGKIREIKSMCAKHEVVAYTDLLDGFEIVEDGDSFKVNALIKARAVFNALGDGDAIVIADDSGISIDALGGEPGIYSARYAGVDATDVDNLNAVLSKLHEKGVSSSPAHYTAAIAMVSASGESVVHGWMYGVVVDTPRGDGGFGYDPIFVPCGYDKTLGELSDDVKKEISHRAKALRLLKIVLSA